MKLFALNQAFLKFAVCRQCRFDMVPVRFKNIRL